MKVIKNIKKKTKQFSEDNLEHKAREGVLKESEEKYKTLVETSGEGMLLTNRQGIITYLNPELEKMFKINASGALGTHFTKYLTKTSVLKSIKLFFKLLKGKSFKLLELEAVNKEKQVFPIDVSASPIIKKEKTEGMVCIIRDITERKKAEAEVQNKSEQIKAQSEKLQSIVDKLAKARAYSDGLIKTMSDGLAVIDRDGIVIDTNRALLKTFGLKSQEIMGLPFGQLLGSMTDPAELKKANDIMKQVFAGTSVENVEMSFTNKGGKKITASVSPNLVSDAKGNPVMMFIVVRDITERKKTEEKIKIFSRAVEGAYDSFVLADMNGNVTYANESAIKTFGYSPEEIMKLNVAQFTANPEDAMKITKEMKTKKSWSGELISIRKNKGTFPVILSISFLKDDEGNPTGRMGIFRDITELKKAQEETEGARAYSEGLISSMLDGLWVIDLQGKTIDVNSAMVKILGYESRDELFKKNPADVTSKKDLEATVGLVKESLGGKPCSGEISMIRKDGKEILVSISATAMKKLQGKMIGAFAVIKDITERKRVEEAIKKSEEYFRAITENILDIIIIVNKRGVINYISPSIEHFTGYKPEEVVGKSAFDFIYSADLPRAAVDFAKALMTKKTNIPNSFRVLHKDGSERILEGLGRNLFDNPAVAGFVMNVRDVTEHKRIEDAIRTSENNFRALADNAFDGLLVGVREGVHVYANKRAAEMTGYSIAELLRTTIKDLVHPDEFEKLLERYQRRLKGMAVPNPYETVIIRKDGRSLPIELTGARTIWQGEPADLVFFRDITERKKAEEELEKSKIRLDMATEASQIGVWELDLINDTSIRNLRHDQIFGYKKKIAEWGAKIFFEHIIPEGRPSVQAAFDEAMKTDRLFFECRILWPDKSIHWITATGKVVRDSAGKPQKMLGTVTDITERKKAEEALRESEAKYKALFINAAEGIVVADVQTKKFSYANPALCRMFGYTEKEFLRIGVADIHPKESLGHVLAEFDAQARGEKTLAPDLPCLRKDGTIFYANVSAVATVLDGRKCNVGFFTDVTERKQAEEKIKLFSDAVASSFDYFFVTDMKGSITYVNESAIRAFGYTPEEFLGLNTAKLDADLETGKKVIQNLMMKGKWSGEVMNIRKNKENFPSILSAFIVKDKEGNPKGMMGILRDITEQKKAEAAVLEEKNKLEKYLNVAGAIILFLSPEGKVLLINKKGCEILGYEPKDVLNKDWFTDFIPEKDKDKARTGFDGLIEGKADKIEYFETHILAKNKSQMNVGWGSVVIKDELGKRQTVLSTGIDISELEQAKTTISQLSEVNKLKDDFLNIATHELKTPLTTIIGLSEIMKEKSSSLNPESQKYINIINAEGRKLNHIIKRVLTVTRFESGREIIAEEKINLKELIFSFLPSLEVVTKKKDLK